jgi:histidyl-tRNA synthetase
VVYQGAGTDEQALALAEELRGRSYRVLVHAGGGSFKSQMKKADASGAAYALIVGEDELAAGEVSLKPLRAEGEQRRIGRERLLEAFAETISREKS